MVDCRLESRGYEVVVSKVGASRPRIPREYSGFLTPQIRVSDSIGPSPTRGLRIARPLAEGGLATANDHL